MLIKKVKSCNCTAVGTVLLQLFGMCALLFICCNYGVGYLATVLAGLTLNLGLSFFGFGCGAVSQQLGSGKLGALFLPELPQPLVYLIALGIGSINPGKESLGILQGFDVFIEAGHDSVTFCKGFLQVLKLRVVGLGSTEAQVAGSVTVRGVGFEEFLGFG